MKTSKAKSIWKGSLKEGNGTMNITSVQQELPYTFLSRFGDGKEANPEELIAAAHSGCYSMALSALISDKGYVVKSVSTEAEIVMKEITGGFGIAESNLTVKADIPGITEELFMKLALDAKENCPVSQALSSLTINLHAELIS